MTVDLQILNMLNNSTFSITGRTITTNQITLTNNSWNLISYNLETQQTPNNAFSTINGKYDRVSHYNGTAWLEYMPGVTTPSEITINTIQYKKGYYVHINSTEDVTLTYTE